MLIAAAGYIINDYFDTQADLINKPKRVLVGVSIQRREAMILHAIMNIMGIGIGVYLSFYIKLPTLSMVFLIATGLLWFYSTNYKRQFLIGNLAVSFLTALVPLMVILFEIPLLNREYGEVMLRNSASFGYLIAWVGAFSFFAFVTTLIREVIKDAEDFEGDRAYGMKTVPIVLGNTWTKVALVVLIAWYPGCIALPAVEIHSFFSRTTGLYFPGLFCPVTGLAFACITIQVLLARRQEGLQASQPFDQTGHVGRNPVFGGGVLPGRF